jgi:hypothetical protein
VHELKHRYDQEFEHLVDRYCTYGPPDAIIEGLRKYVDAGTSYFILAPILIPGRQREGLERYAREVLPALRKMTPAPVL